MTSPDAAKSAQSLWFIAPRHAELREEEVLPPGPGQIQVRSSRSLVSVGSEMNLYKGEGNLEDFGLFPTAKGQFPFPLKFGYQEIGEVVAAPEESTFSSGDTVLCFHPHQTLFTIDEAHATKVPPTLTPEQASFARLFGVALNACITTPPIVGDCVAVSGLGVIGMFAGYLARLTALTLILVEPSAERRRRAAWIGADAVVNPSEAADAVAELTDGRGVDLYIEASGAPPALQGAILQTAQEGTVTVVGWYGTRPVNLSLSPEFHLRRTKIISTGPGMAPHLAPRWSRSRLSGVAWTHLANFEPSNLLTHRVPFTNAPEAYRLLDDPSAETLAVSLEYGP